MRVVRFLVHGKKRYGTIEGEAIKRLRGSPFKRSASHDRFVFDGTTRALGEVKLMAPCQPSKLVCLGLNYRSHAAEVKLAVPSVPLIFLKPSTSVIGPGDSIIMPPQWQRVDYEGELGVVIGKTANNVAVDEAQEYIFGYTCVNDVTERYIQKEDVQWTRAKGFDTFAPIGPWIETEAGNDLKLETLLNGEVRQSSRTSDLIFGVPELVHFISGIMTLLPGDVISTGTPSGIGRMKPGDVVEVRIEGIGTLRNPVSDAPC